MAKTMSFKEGVKRHPEITVRPVSTRDWQQRFQPNPPTSLEALLIKLGPFNPAQDAFRFNNNFTFTDDQVEQIRQRYRLAIDSVLGASPLQFVRDVLNKLRVHIPLVGRVGLPDVVIDAVIGDVRTELMGLLTGLIFDLKKPTFGRCGGMAFSGYDFYLLGWTVDARLGTSPPATGVLGDYIFSRLLDSLDLNAGKFLEWFTNLHLMPKVSVVANASLGAAVGSLGGPIGTAFGAYLGSHVDVFDLGGPKSLLQLSTKEWSRIKSTLDMQAAWPVGFLFRESGLPIYDHQVLAVDYDEGTATLTVWDNRDGATHKDLILDFSGDELSVDDGYGNHITGIFLEEYSPHKPPDSLRLS